MTETPETPTDSRFSVGDTVVCLNANDSRGHLTPEKEYRVVEVSSSNNLGLEGVLGHWSPERFLTKEAFLDRQAAIGEVPLIRPRSIPRFEDDRSVRRTLHPAPERPEVDAAFAAALAAEPPAIRLKSGPVVFDGRAVSRDDYLAKFREITETMYQTTKMKNSDYADSADAFQNFRNCEALGLASLEVGIMVRISDKMQRVANLLKRDPATKSESIRDSVLDMAVYSVILLTYLETKS